MCYEHSQEKDTVLSLNLVIVERFENLFFSFPVDGFFEHLGDVVDGNDGDFLE